MERDVLASRFAASARRARDFAQTMVVEDLPQRLVFRVRLNQSYDRHPLPPHEVRYPEEDGRTLNRCDEDAAVAELWRDGHVPQWVNLAVVGAGPAATVVEAVCCGRFTSDDDRLYHVDEGAPPFHVLGPALPADGSRPFSLHHRAECWDDADLDGLPAGHVRMFTLATSAFDRTGLAALPNLPHLEVFEHHAGALGTDALAAFARFPRLAFLRLHLIDNNAFDVRGSARALATLRELSVRGLPARPWGHADLATRTPALTAMRLQAVGSLSLSSVWPAEVRTISIAATAVAAPAALPPALERLTITLAEGDDGMVASLLSGVGQVDHLSVSGTPVTDALLPGLTRIAPKSLDLSGTGVTSEARVRLQATHPDLRVTPRQ